MSNPFDFTGATAVVLGGATGLGLAMAEGLAAHGAAVCIASRSAERARNAAATLAERFGTPCHGYAADAASEDAVNRLRDHVADLFGGRVNIAIDSAGINVRNPIDQISLRVRSRSARQHHGRVPVRTGHASTASSGRLGAADQRGEHLCVTLVPVSHELCGSKGAMLQLTRTLAIEWAAEKITVNAISPGPFITDMTRPVLDNPEAYRQFCTNIPMARFAEPHEIVTACLFLASPASSYVTGAEIVVDGGWMVT